MPDLNSILDDCFRELSLEFEVEKVDFVPRGGKKAYVEVPVWRIMMPAEAGGEVTDVEVFMAFPKGFPYEMPCVITPDDRFRYLPHISFDDRKLCLYEDGVTYDAENIRGIIRANLSKSRQWIETYANRDNSDEYAKEIKNYWRESYDGEEEVDDCAVLFGVLPDKTCELKGFAYSKFDLDEDDNFLQRVFFESNDTPEEIYIKRRHKTVDFPALFLSSLKIPAAPPYSLTAEQLIQWITDNRDKQAVKSFINRNGKGYILFSIGLSYVLGGVFINELNTKRKGFRRGMITPFYVLTNFENKSRHLQRLIISTFNSSRIAERTAGELMPKHRFVIAGLGSVGSNLCYYLNGYNNAEFVLLDRDRLNNDNIGRHLLGYEYLNQRKVHGVAHYIESYRPDRKVTALNKHVQDVYASTFNTASAIFICTGDVMSERWLLRQMADRSIRIPSFILWLEPYGVSGIMVYVNPADKDSIARVEEKAGNGFMEYSLIEEHEYINGEKLIKRDVGCNGHYAPYSANDVTLFLSAMFQYIDQLLNSQSETKVYRWVGNIDIARRKGIQLVPDAAGLEKHSVQELPV